MKCVHREKRYPGGKGVELELCVHNARIVRVSISGDFFVFPETCVESLERSLLACSSEACIEAAFDKVISECEALGFDWGWLKGLVLEVWREVTRHA